MAVTRRMDGRYRVDVGPPFNFFDVWASPVAAS